MTFKMARKQNSTVIPQLSALVNQLFLSLVIVMICQELDQQLLIDFRSHFLSSAHVTTASVSFSRRSSLLVGAVDCPKRCSCEKLTLRVNCTSSGLDVIPHMFNPRLTDLDFSHNRIKSLGYALHIYPRLRHLNLACNEIRNISVALAKLEQLEILNLEGNRISDLSSDSLINLRELAVLSLNSNGLRNVARFVFSHLKQLETLDLSRNEISFLLDDAFMGLQQLQALNLRRNQFGLIVTPDDAAYEDHVKPLVNDNAMYSDKPWNVLSLDGLRSDYLPNLRILDMGEVHFSLVAKYWSPFSSSQGNVMVVWHNLTELYLDGCMIEYIEPGSLDGLISLLILKLHDNSLVEIPSEVFKDMPKLEVLDISRNGFTSIEEGAFSWLPQLQSINISDCQYLETIKPGAFKGNINLERLDLSFNPNLQALDAETFDDLPALKYLFLRGNNFTTIDENWVPLGRRLELLDIRDIELVCNCDADPLRQILVDMRSRSENDSNSDKVNTSEGSVNRIELNVTDEFNKIADKWASFWTSDILLSDEKSSQEAIKERESSSSAVTIKESSSSLRSLVLAATEVTCKEPEDLSEQRLISLDSETLGCYDMEWLMIMIALMVVGIIIVAACITFGVRYRRRQNTCGRGGHCQSRHSFRSPHAVNGSSVAASDHQPLSESKLYHFHSTHTTSAIYDLDNEYARPDFIVPLTIPGEKIDMNVNVSRTPTTFNEYEDDEAELRRTLQPKRVIPSTDL